MICPICLENINHKMTLICFHYLCHKCYKKWFTINLKKTCPLCRKKMFQYTKEEIIINDEYHSRFTKYTFDDET